MTFQQELIPSGYEGGVFNVVDGRLFHLEKEERQTRQTGESLSQPAGEKIEDSRRAPFTATVA